MLKGAIVLMVVSLVAIFFQSELAYVLRYLLVVHDKIAHALAMIFSNSSTGRLIQEVFALVVIPVVLGLLASLIWLMIRRKEMPHLMTTVWMVWAILLVAILLQPMIHRAPNYQVHASHRTTH